MCTHGSLPLYCIFSLLRYVARFGQFLEANFFRVVLLSLASLGWFFGTDFLCVFGDLSLLAGG